jgi:hypothetical protein
MATEVLHETLRPPDLGEFAQLLENPGYHPPEYVFDPTQPGGFSLPGEATAGDTTDELPSDTVRAILRVDYITSDKDSGARTLHCRYDHDGEEVRIPDSPSIQAFQTRMGRRKIAVDMQVNPETERGTITAVHGVEPIYHGEPLDPDHTPNSLLIETAVIDAVPAVDLTSTFVNATGKVKELVSQLPIMRVLLDPADPESGVWLAREYMGDLSEDGVPSNPLPGDTVQVRIAPKMYYPEGLDRMVVPLDFAVGTPPYSTVKTSYIMRGGGLRQLELEDRLDETAAVVADINAADTPSTVAQLANRYFDGRYRVERRLSRDVFGEREYNSCKKLCAGR